jgi:L-fuculose-phosphate aldolase
MLELRQRLIATARRMSAVGLNRGTAGNLSVRVVGAAEGFLITPTGMDYDALEAEDIVFMRPRREPRMAPAQPSSEWRFHRDLYLAQPRRRRDSARPFALRHQPGLSAPRQSRPFTT